MHSEKMIKNGQECLHTHKLVLVQYAFSLCTGMVKLFDLNHHLGQN